MASSTPTTISTSLAFISLPSASSLPITTHQPQPQPEPQPQPQPLGTLTTLPAELRNLIYDFLTPSADPTSPFSASKFLADRIGIGAVSHIPPPINVLLACKRLCEEVMTVYYGKTVFTIERVLDLFCPWGILGVEGVFACVFGGVRRVAVRVFWGWVGSGGGGASALVGILGDGVICPREKEVRDRVERMRRLVDVLVKAREFRFLSLEWTECAPLRVPGDQVDFEWELEARKRVLEPLKLLRGLKSVEGIVVAGGEVEGVIGGVLGEVRRDMRERDDGGEEGREVDIREKRKQLAVEEDKKVLSNLLVGERKHLLTPDEIESHRRKKSYFE